MVTCRQNSYSTQNFQFEAQHANTLLCNEVVAHTLITVLLNFLVCIYDALSFRILELHVHWKTSILLNFRK